MTNFLNDSTFGMSLPEKLRDKLWVALQIVQQAVDGELQGIKTTEKMENLNVYYPNANHNLPLYEDENFVNTLTRTIYNAIGEGYNYRKGFWTGVASRNIDFTWNRKLNVWRPVKYTKEEIKLNPELKKKQPNWEHFVSIKTQSKLWLYDCVRGNWKIEKVNNAKKITKGADIINDLYSRLNLVVLTTEYENKELILKQEEQIVESNTDINGQVDIINIVKMLLNADHYKLSGVKFYDETIPLQNRSNMLAHFDKLPEEFKRLMSSKKTLGKNNFKDKSTDISFNEKFFTL